MKTQILCSITFFENRAVYEILSKNLVQPEGPQMTSQFGAHWISKTIYTHTHARAHASGRTHTHRYIIIIAFSRQQWFANALNVTLYVHCLSCYTCSIYRFKWTACFGLCTLSSSNAMKVICFYTQWCSEYWDVNLWQACVMEMQIHE